MEHAVFEDTILIRNLWDYIIFLLIDH